jgi:cell division protein FtsQ
MTTEGPTTGPERQEPDGPARDETVVVAGADLRRRRFRARVRRLRPVLYAGGAAVLVLALVWLVLFSSVLTVRRVVVTGTGTLSDARITAAAKVPLHEQLVKVDLAAVQARVEAIPAVRSAAVSRSWPHAITIAVTERVPIAVVDRGTVLQAVDADGVLFGHYGHPPADLPVVRTEPDVKAAALAEAAKVVTSLRRDIAARVQHVDVASADEITLRLDGGLTVVWGSADSSAAKAEVLAVLLGHVTKKDPVSVIDVSVPGRPTTK